jgi:hypothetical protein
LVLRLKSYPLSERLKKRTHDESGDEDEKESGREDSLSILRIYIESQSKRNRTSNKTTIPNDLAFN